MSDENSVIHNCNAYNKPFFIIPIIRHAESRRIILASIGNQDRQQQVKIQFLYRQVFSVNLNVRFFFKIKKICIVLRKVFLGSCIR